MIHANPKEIDDILEIYELRESSLLSPRSEDRLIAKKIADIILATISKNKELFLGKLSYSMTTETTEGWFIKIKNKNSFNIVSILIASHALRNYNAAGYGSFEIDKSSPGLVLVVDKKYISLAEKLAKNLESSFSIEYLIKYAKILKIIIL